MYMSTIKLHVNLCDFVRERERQRQRQIEERGVHGERMRDDFVMHVHVHTVHL